MRLLILLFVLLANSTIRSQEVKVEVPQIAIRMDLGETVEIEGILITFEKVLEDSRCPEKVQCVWAGRARVEVIVQAENEDAVVKEVILGQRLQHEVIDRKLYVNDEFIIKVISIRPYPEKPGILEDYSLLIRKVKNDQ
ncbi:MAG: hypothetical protein DWQ02_08685 [Bacteroidetes bacterium]|nr:MAG: hypothetical protein DWQ02_08685 [Bacteroidota bacterium]